MALQPILGTGPFFPVPKSISVPPAFASTLVIDATGEQISMSGRVWFPARTGTKDIERLGFRFGAVTKAGGSALTVSLQNVSLTAGPPMQPDGTPDQTVAIANANAAFAANTWIRTGTLSANRTVSFGELLSVVVEFDVAGRLGADSVVVSGLGVPSALNLGLLSVNALNAAGFALQNSYPVVILEMSDGTFGTLDLGFPCSAMNVHLYNSGSTPDEHALAFTVPFTCVIDGLWAYTLPATGGDFDIVLYDGTTPLASVSTDANAVSAAAARLTSVPIPEQTLSPGVQYYISVLPTTANNVSAYSFDVADANHLTCHDGGIAMNYSTRTNAGAWAAVTTTRRLYAGFRISQLEDGTGGGGGAAILAGGGLGLVQRG